MKVYENYWQARKEHPDSDAIFYNIEKDVFTARYKPAGKNFKYGLGSKWRLCKFEEEQDGST